MRDRIQRISFLAKDGIYREPTLKFETYRRVIKDGKKQREHECFALIEEAEKFRDSTSVISTAKSITPGDVVSTAKGITLGDAVEDWKEAYLPHIQAPSRENILKVFPNLQDRRPGRELPCDFLLPYEMKDLGGKPGVTIIDKWLAHVKRVEYVATLKGTRLSFVHEVEVLNRFFNYFESRVDRESFRSPILREHRKMAKIKDRKPMADKDLPMEIFQRWLDALFMITAETRWAYVLPKLGEFEYISKTRVSEAAAIHVEDANPTHNVVTISKSIQWLRKGGVWLLRDGTKKNGGFRIPSGDLVRLVLEVAMKRGIRSGPIFYVDAAPIPYKVIQRYFNRAHFLARTGMSATHVLRHGALKEFQELTGDLNQTKTAANHSDVATTQIYAQPRESEFRKTQERFEERLRTMRVVR